MDNTQDDLGAFFKENAKLIREYFETRMKIYRLRAIRLIAKSAGNFLWMIIFLFLLFVLIIFTGIVVGLWMSEITGSTVAGFGIATGFILLLIILCTAFRKTFFINPLIKAFIKRSEENIDEE